MGIWTLAEQRVDPSRPYTHTRLQIYRERPYEPMLSESLDRQNERIDRGVLLGLEQTREDVLGPTRKSHKQKSRALTSNLSDSCLLTRIDQEPDRRYLSQTRLAASMVPHQPVAYIPNPKGTEWANAQDYLYKSRKHLDLRPFLDEKVSVPFKTMGPFPLSTFVPRPLLF